MTVVCLLIALNLHGIGDCPSARDVERELGPLLGEEVAAHDVATIATAADGAVSLSLADPAGQPIGERMLPHARTCGEQAKAIAVTLAVWEAQLHPEISLGLDRLAPSEPPPVIAAQTAPPPPAHQLTLGLAVLGDWQSSTWAPGARLDLALGPADARWKIKLAAGAIGQHTIDLPPGLGRWWRAFAQLGVDFDVARGRRWAGALGGGFVGSVVSTAGSGFAVDRTTRSLDLGGEARARVEARLGRQSRVRPWVGVLVAMWARRQTLDLQGAATSAALPRIEPMAALGVDFVR